MKKLFHQFLATVFLLLFVGVQLNKSIHDFYHKDDFHCGAVNEKHLHEQERKCNLCDFQFTPDTQLTINSYTIITFSGDFYFQTTSTAHLYATPNSLLSGRAPPIC